VTEGATEGEYKVNDRVIGNRGERDDQGGGDMGGKSEITQNIIFSKREESYSTDGL